MKKLIDTGEKVDVEFKKSRTDITKDVYDSVCSFNNRNGGHIFLGVLDDRTVLGVEECSIEKMMKDFTTAINNPGKIYPPLYLTPEECEIEPGKKIIYIYVPEGQQVRRHNGKFWDRTYEGDIDITLNEEMVYKLYSRKQGSYFVNKVYAGFGLEFLDENVIEKARKMAVGRKQDHPWGKMTNEEMLRSSGLILTDMEKNVEGITLAAILLFGKDTSIMSVLPQFKTDAIFRIKNMDRYDDREVVITNLIDSYDRLMEFGKKHLNDTFVMEGIQSISARDKILREIISNILAHRDFSSGYPARFVIERKCILTENGNLAHGIGELQLERFEPFPKNPPISKVFREIGYADELGSGMRNTNKYSKMYSGGIPSFKEGDIFVTTIPLEDIAEITVGPSADCIVQDEKQKEQVREQVREQVEEQVIKDKILKFCSQPRKRQEIIEYCGYKGRRNFVQNYVKPLLKSGELVMTVPDKPNSSSQRYLTKSKEIVET